MSEPYLILHKVRGEPAFDIAIRLLIGDEVGWVLSTSGYRAYPFWFKELADVCDNGCGFHPEMPSDAQDCFASNDRPIREATYNVYARAAGLLAKLGLVSKVERRD